MGNVSSIQYNERGNVLKSISADGKEINYSYFTTGLVNKVIDANNTSSLYEYDSMNRLISVTTGGSQKTEYTYEETGALAQTIDPYGRITNYDYDNLGQLIKKVGIKGDVTQLSYDENGNLTKEITPKGQSKFFYYDNLNQLVRKLLPDDVYNFEYDVRGNVTSVSNLLSKIDLEYEHFDGGDVISKAHSYGIGDGADLPNTLIQYGYNQMGDRTSMITPVGTFQYGRDAMGRLKTITKAKSFR
jgi:YD repeat-containing protein